MQLMLPMEYLADAIKLVKTSTSRVYLIGLTIFRDDVTKEFIDVIVDAARRGVDVHVAADFMTFTYSIKGIKSLPLTYRAKSLRATTDLQKEFKAAGVKFRWLGQHTGPLFTGRTHSKWLVVDDTVFSFGGVNTESNAFTKHVDYMFKIQDNDLADLLAKEHLAVEKADRTRQSARNHRKLMSVGTVLFDGGRPGRSIIYNTALKLAESASEILLVSQYCPTGKLGKILNQKPSQVYFNQLKNVDSRGNRMIIRIGKLRQHFTNLYRHKKYLHAKFMIFTMPDGSRQAITGSYNFVAATARLGTREVALVTSDESAISQLEKFWRENIK